MSTAQGCGAHAGLPPFPQVSVRGVQAAVLSGRCKTDCEHLSPLKAASSHSGTHPQSGPEPMQFRVPACTMMQCIPWGPSPKAGHLPWAQSILVGSFLFCLASRSILARERRMGTAMGRKRGM